MTDATTTAQIVPYRKPAMTNAERQKAWRDRQRAAKLAAAPAPLDWASQSAERLPSVRPQLDGAGAAALTRDPDAATPFREASQKTAERLPPVRPQRIGVAAPPVIDVMPVTKPGIEPSRWVLRGASVALAAVGLSMNAVYAHSLGSSDLSGWLFLALGVAADASALVLPSVAASSWKAGDRLAAASAWAAFAVVFAFAIIGAVGFASTSISDVTTLRQNRVTPAVTAAQAALADAQGARDRECKGGVGKFCREREAAVQASRQNLDMAMHAIAQTGDPQAAALVHVVTWVSAGRVMPTEADVGMVRLILMSLLPQLGGVLLMAARR